MRSWQKSEVSVNIKDLAKLFDLALDHENDIIATVETIVECKENMWEKKGCEYLKEHYSTFGHFNL